MGRHGFASIFDEFSVHSYQPTFDHLVPGVAEFRWLETQKCDEASRMYADDDPDPGHICGDNNVGAYEHMVRGSARLCPRSHGNVHVDHLGDTRSSFSFHLLHRTEMATKGIPSNAHVTGVCLFHRDAASDFGRNCL